jgi:hypothetical protein
MGEAVNEPNSWIVHGLECDDGHKLPPTELVRLIDLEEERRSSHALMKLLSDEKFKSERLAAALRKCSAELHNYHSIAGDEALDAAEYALR